MFWWDLLPRWLPRWLAARRPQESSESSGATSVEHKGTRIAQLALVLIALTVVLAGIQVRFIERHGGSWWYGALIPVAMAVVFLALAGIDAFELDRGGRAAERKLRDLGQARAWLSRGLVALLIAAIFAVAMEGVTARGAGPGMSPLLRIQHLVVIYEENHSFDNLYGLWERVNGLSNADRAHTRQIGQSGTPYKCLLQDDVNLTSPPLPADACSVAAGDPFNGHFPNKPFEIDKFVSPTTTTCPPDSDPYSHKNGVPKGSGSPGGGGCTRDLVHGFYEAQYQLNGGAQNRYVTGSDAAGLAMGYYNTSRLPIYIYLHRDGHPRYAILDDFFQAAFGGSFLNHQWLIAAASPVCNAADNCPAEAKHSVLDANGFPREENPPDSELLPATAPLYVSPGTGLVKPVNGPLTQACGKPTTVVGLACGDYGVNTMQPAFQPSRSSYGPGAELPAQTNPTIGDRLSAKGIDWAWYSGGWSNANGDVNAPGWTNKTVRAPTPSGCSDPNVDFTPQQPVAHWPNCPNRLFQYHHQPFNYFASFSTATPTGLANRAAHLRDEQEFIQAAQSSTNSCNLKAVSFVKPIGQQNEHPGYASEHKGSKHLVSLLKAIESGTCAKDTMVVVTYDEFGGQWDHVPPPGQEGTPGPHNIWGPGPRVPALVISPFLGGDFVVDHTQHDTTSILATIEHRFDLAPLSSRDSVVEDLSSVFAAT
jgi:acid phosphatase